MILLIDFNGIIPAMNEEQIKILIEKGIEKAKVSVRGDQGKFEATVISQKFEGLNTLKRHQLVYGTVNDEIASGALHALTIIAKTPDELS